MRTIVAVAISLSVEGRAVPADPGQTVAAALVAAGIRVCRIGMVAVIATCEGLACLLQLLFQPPDRNCKPSLLAVA